MKLFKLILCIFLIVFSGCNLFEKKPIKIGVILPLNLKYDGAGEVVLKVLNLSVLDINSNGGIDGHNLQLVVEDGECSVAGGKRAAERLIEKFDVNYIVGGFCSDETVGASSVTELNDMILFSPGSTSSEISNLGDFVFRTVQSNLFGAEVLAEYAFNEGRRKLAVFTELTEFTFSAKNSFVQKFTELGGEVIFSSSFDSSSSLNLLNFYDKLNSSDVDSLLFLTQNREHFNAAVVDLKKQNISLPIYSHGYLTSKLSTVGVEDYLTGSKFYITNVSKNTEKNEELIKKLSDFSINEFAFGMEFSYFTAAYDTIQILSLAISNCSNVFDNICVKNYLNSIENYEGHCGKITFDENGDPFFGVLIVEFIGGEFKILD